MSASIRFIDGAPPASRRPTQPRALAIAEELEKRPGVWAIIREGEPRTIGGWAGNLRAKMKPLPVEIVSRGRLVFARWVGGL